MSLITKVDRINRDYSDSTTVGPSSSDISLNVYWKNPFTFDNKLNSPDTILNYKFGIFKSEKVNSNLNTSDLNVIDLISSEENNALRLSETDNLLYVEDKKDGSHLDDLGNVDFLAHYLIARG